MRPGFALGIDVGTSGVKVVAVGQSDASWGPRSRVVAASTGRYRAGGGAGELDPADVWQTVSRTVRRVTSTQPPGGRDAPARRRGADRGGGHPDHRRPLRG